MRELGPVGKIFRELIDQGQISPVERMEDLRLPGELDYVPSLTRYGTPEIPVQSEISGHAELGRRSS